ncbi:hypothetical protein GCM10023216_14550 [Isoptericola chiayiensis]|uniref:Putative Flp pilus-assembly TadG-like N-terminal domain-containing protein n=2 Tax=Isoptericola chiayiensis TaxID=579446 RepID=A0ABP8YAE5_9MICO
MSARRCADERGSIHVAVIPMVVGLLAAAVLVIVVLGGVTGERRESTTAADAAALAAAETWDRELEDTFTWRAGSSEHVSFWALAGTPVSATVDAGAMRAKASEFAERNGAELREFSVDTERLEVSVSVRNRSTVPETSTRVPAEATARIELTGGLCLSGVQIGYRLPWGCQTWPEAAPTPPPAPTPTPTPSPSPSDGEEPEPEPSDEPTPWTPPPFVRPDVDPYESEVVLTR